MSNHPACFIWYDLMTSDIKAAELFYKNVIGWDAKDSGLPEPYTIFSVGPTGIAGLMQITEQAYAAGARPGWTGYIRVNDVDVYVERIKATGGKLHHGPKDVPGIGRFAIVADPHGSVFALFKETGGPQRSLVAPGAHGHIGWHELHAGEGESAFAFYAGLFGWSKAEALDMGSMGVYQIFTTGGEPAGGMMTKMPDMSTPCWLYYINVDALDTAVARAIGGGGKVIIDPHQVPTGSWIVQCLDPQGAMFALVAEKR